MYLIPVNGKYVDMNISLKCSQTYFLLSKYLPCSTTCSLSDYSGIKFLLQDLVQG